MEQELMKVFRSDEGSTLQATETSLARILFHGHPTGMLPISALAIEHFPKDLVEQFYRLRSTYGIQIEGDRATSLASHAFQIFSHGKLLDTVAIGESTNPRKVLTEINEKIMMRAPEATHDEQLRLPVSKAPHVRSLSASTFNKWDDRDDVISYARENARWLIANPQTITGPFKAVAFAEALNGTYDQRDEGAQLKPTSVYLLGLREQNILSSFELGLIAGELQQRMPKSMLPRIVLALAHIGTSDTLEEDVANSLQGMEGLTGTPVDGSRVGKQP